MVLWRLLNRGAPIFPEEGQEDPPYWVIEEGLCGRTSCREDPIEGDLNGLRQLIPILESHKPLDWVAIMLGINDLKRRFNPSAFDTAVGVRKLADAVRNSRCGPDEGPPQVLMICPPPMAASGTFAHIFGDALELSKKLAPYFRVMAKESGVFFLDAGGVIQSSPADGLHLEAEDHRKLAEAVAAIIERESATP
jgi:lysophospholipase L1-like esterase